MTLASQDKLAQVRCMQMLRSERTYVLVFANERSSLAVLVRDFPKVSITGNDPDTKMLTRRLHLAEDIMQETVNFGWSSCTKGVEDLTAAPDLPRLYG